jgi:predicted O-methyltransferase YrrM
VNPKLARAKLLYQIRGLRWLAVSALAELPLWPRMVSSFTSGLSVLSSPSWLAAVGGVHSNQLWAERRDAIRRVAREHLGASPCAVLEIGTWFGRGSTQVWLEALPSGSTLMCVDVWRPYMQPGENVKATANMDGMSRIALMSVLKETARAEQRGISMSIVRASASEFLPLLRDQSFDLIYVDGSHIYQDVKRDLEQASRLIKPGGVICGDDLDQKPTVDLLAVARQHLDSDTFVLTDGSAIHPGVMLAVAEAFGDVDSQDGFWWRR